jgi:hypothetical protein
MFTNLDDVAAWGAFDRKTTKRNYIQRNTIFLQLCFFRNAIL